MFFCFLFTLRHPRSPRTVILFPYSMFFRSLSILYLRKCRLSTLFRCDSLHGHDRVCPARFGDELMTATIRALSNSGTDPHWQVKEDLAAAYRLVHRLGLDDSIYTHISARLPGGHDRFLINPYGMRFEEVKASNLVTVDIDGAVIDDPLGLGINPAGFTIHSAIHSARPDVVCVLHTHTVAGVAVSCQQDGLLPLNQWSMQFTDRIAYHT